MGLEVAEILLATEETFGIRIDDEVQAVSTPGDLSDYVLRKLEERQANGELPEHRTACPDTYVFLRLREAMRRLVPEGGPEITPDSPLTSLFPAPVRRERWRELSESLDWYLPELARPPALVRFLIACWVAIALGSLWLGLNFFSLVLFLTWPYGFAAAWLTRPFILRFPEKCNTLHELAQHISVRELGVYMFSRRDMDRAQRERYVWKQVQAIVCDKLLIPPEKVTRDARFIDDLGTG